MSSAICVFFFNDTAPTEIYTLSLHDALPIYVAAFVAAYILLTYLHVVLGEQAPKALAIRRAEDVALFVAGPLLDRKSTRLNSSHSSISYAVFCLKKKKNRSSFRAGRANTGSQ